MAIGNASFETAGATAGQAASWTVATTSTVEELAEFGTTPAPWETFEVEWGNEPLVTAFELVDVSLTKFDDGTPTFAEFEGFETQWGNVPHFTELGSAESALFDGNTSETFEATDDWDADYKDTFVGIGTDVTLATFDGNDFETFEASDGWDATYKTAFVGIGTDVTLAAFNILSSGTPSTENVETFNRTKALPQVFSINVGADQIITPVAHGMGANELVMFVAGTGELPAPLNEVTIYTISGVSSTIMNVSDASGPVDITDTGTGVGHTVLADPTYFWNSEE